MASPPLATFLPMKAKHRRRGRTHGERFADGGQPSPPLANVSLVEVKKQLGLRLELPAVASIDEGFASGGEMAARASPPLARASP
ncbi:hypothetical protein R1flu_028743 [Riccia fluitans]|uniref:Uncharacterized protein n=1 Tax=Riccia fluitans TaxID=41844 RepID=A0ABD1XMM0_9MARC